tara:strand:+ start:1834 stop:3108 length:1275 start_codon:yes stop_codon:yes gene_type:complete
MKIVGISFSHAENSLQTRGLKLLNEEKLFDSVYDMTDFDMPVCYSNKSDGNVPDSVEQFNNALDADILVFAISEATSHYSAGFKNAMDWLVVKSKFNAKLGTDYAITDKPIFVITFTPTSKAPNGARHFEMTEHLLTKMGANVIQSFVVNDSWNCVVPGAFINVKHIYDSISEYSSTHVLKAKKEIKDNSLTWITDYEKWDTKWKYEIKNVHRVNGIPWPRLPKNAQEIVEVPLKQDYKLRSMSYLDTQEARPIFEKQADIIIENNIKGIVDVGCRIGTINDVLHQKGYKDYNYFGFDTSPQPIEFANEVWRNNDNISYAVGNMYDNIPVDFEVDCVIWSGVLLYDPNNHMQLFNNVTFEYYNSKHAIIQEPCKEQHPSKWLPNMRLNTIEQDLYKYKEQYNYQDWVVDANIFSGKRRIAHIWK